MPLSPGTRLGPYQIAGTLGAGGMGAVYRARDTRLERDVALKQVLAGAGERRAVLREARAASALSHPNICTIHEVLDAGGESFIVMELVDGQPLQALIPAQGLPLESIVHYGTQIAEAVAHAHERGVLHGDLKSANVVITASGRAKLLDFGLARRLTAEQLSTATRSQEPGVLAGTLAYMAPELLRGEPGDRRSDIWAVGVMLFEMATGRQPFAGGTGFEVSASILGAPVSIPPDVAPGLAAVILRCLARDPRQRYQRAEELQAALQTIGDERRLSGRPPGRPRRRGWLGAAAAVLVVGLAALALAGRWLRPGPAAGLEDVRSIAVLPFTDLRGDQRFLADGMTDALISDLSRVPALRVIARTSVMRYRESPQPPAAIAKALGVEALVDGTVVREGDRVRVTVALVDPATNHQRWSGSYDAEASDILSLEREIAGTITRELRGVLAPQAAASPRPVHPEAHEAYLRGLFHWNRRTETDVRQAIEYYNQAIARDPTLARAYVGLAQAYGVLGFYVWLPPEDVFPRAKAAAARALALEPDNAEAYAALAYAKLYYDWDWAAAEADFRRALELNDGSAVAHQWYANYLTAVGRWDEALAEMRRAQALDPLSSIASAAIGWVHCYARQYDEAVAALQRTLALDAGFLQAYRWLAWAHGELGNWDEAREAAEGAARLSSRGAVPLTTLARVAAQTGRAAEARAILKEVGASAPGAYVPRYDLALVHAALGDHARALDLLEEAYRLRENQLVFLRWDARLAPLRDTGRFRALIDRMRFPGPA